MIETINGKAYLKVGDKVYEVGGGSNIITAYSVEQLPDPASVPEGTIALVPSEGGGGGGGGLPVVELSTVIPQINQQYALTAEESAALETVISTNHPFVVKFTFGEDGIFFDYRVTVNIVLVEGMPIGNAVLMFALGGIAVFGLLPNEDGGWVAQMALQGSAQ